MALCALAVTLWTHPTHAECNLDVARQFAGKNPHRESVRPRSIRKERSYAPEASTFVYTEPMVGAVDFYVPDEYTPGANILCGFEDIQSTNIGRVEYWLGGRNKKQLHVARDWPFHLPSHELDGLPAGSHRIHAFIYAPNDDWIGWIAEDTTIVGSCVGDLNGDGIVNGMDLSLLMSNWGNAAYDLNGDGRVNSLDLIILLGNWGACPG